MEMYSLEMGICLFYTLIFDYRCSSKCTVEAGWMCTGGGATQPDTCFEICGDPYDFWTKPCEDGILNAGG